VAQRNKFNIKSHIIPHFPTRICTNAVRYIDVPFLLLRGYVRGSYYYQSRSFILGVIQDKCKDDLVSGHRRINLLLPLQYAAL
jgi:hypothetical protein